MKAIQCAFHPNQIILNFCSNKKCLLPMCPTCVAIHSADHQEQKTFGNYQNILELKMNIEQSLKKVVQCLISCSENLKDMFVERQQNQKKIKLAMEQIRIKITKSINTYLDEIEIQTIKKIGYNSIETQEEFTQIDTDIKSIYSEIEKQFNHLKTDKMLKAIINHLLTDKIKYYQQKLEDIDSKVKLISLRNKPKYNQLKMSQISVILQKIKDCYEESFLMATQNCCHSKKTSDMSIKFSNIIEKGLF